MADGYDKEQKVSKYNAGLLQMERIHELFRAINFSSMQPTKKDMNGMYGYEVKFSALTSLFMECSGKLKEEQRKDAIKLYNYIDNFLLHNVIVKKLTNSKGGSRGDAPTQNWLVLQKMLFSYELLVRDLLEKTGLNSPEKGEEALI